MNTLYVYLLVSIIVGIYTYYNTKNYPEKSLRMTYVIINMSLAVVAVLFGSMIVDIINHIWGNK